MGAQALWLSLAFGVVLAALIAALASPIVDLVGGEGRTAGYAVTYLRIVAVGMPSAFVALGGQGFLRGVSDLRTPLLLVLAGNALNIALELLFVYGFGWGIRGSAWGTAIAQTAMGAAIAWAILRRVRRSNAAFRPALARRLLSVGKFIFVRTTALIGAFVLTGAVVAHLGDAPLAAHQVAFQLFIFLALVLDAIAIAGQIIVGRELGAGRADAAYAASARMIRLSVAAGAVFAVGLLALHDVLPRGFSEDGQVLHQCSRLWPLFALIQPVAGAVFALDGILIGAGDGPYLAGSMAAAFAVCATLLLAGYEAGWGIRGVWTAIVALMAVRLATLGTRFLRRRWLVTGWAG
jgi:MATE family, multidrug efflux pump